MNRADTGSTTDRALLTIGILSLLFFISAIGYRIFSRPAQTPEAAASVARLDEQLLQAAHQVDALMVALGNLDQASSAEMTTDLEAVRSQGDQLSQAVNDTQSLEKEIHKKQLRISVDQATAKAAAAATQMDVAVSAVAAYVAAEADGADRDPKVVIAAITDARDQLDGARNTLAPAVQP